MAPRPWRPEVELEGALDRGDLRFAIVLAEELRVRRGRPIPLETASRFLPLIARESPGEYSAWACRWLERWLCEVGAPTIEQVATVATSLAELSSEPSTFAALSAAAQIRP